MIDCHAHWIPPTLADALRERATAPRIAATATGERFFTYQRSRPFDAALGDLEARRSSMRDCGIEMQVLSLPGLFGIDSLPLEESAALVRVFNDAAADAQRVCPQRFIGLAALPLADMQAACSELRRASAMGLRGAILPADGFRSRADAQAYRPLFELGQRMRSYFFVHPGPVEPPAPFLVDATGSDNVWQRRIVLDTQARLSEVIMTLNHSDVLDPYPDITVQVANLGGTFAFLTERMNEVARQQPERAELPSQRPSRCHVDTASFGPRAIEMAVACFGADRVVLGTDCPIFDAARMVKSLAETRLDPRQRKQVGSANALRFLAASLLSRPA